MANSQLSSNTGTGFTMRFENGMTISVQFSSMSYCTNRNWDNEKDWKMKYDFASSVHSPDAEVMIWQEGTDEDGKRITVDSTDPFGWVSAEVVGRLIPIVQDSKSVQDFLDNDRALQLINP